MSAKFVWASARAGKLQCLIMAALPRSFREYVNDKQFPRTFGALPRRTQHFENDTSSRILLSNTGALERRTCGHTYIRIHVFHNERVYLHMHIQRICCEFWRVCKYLTHATNLATQAGDGSVRRVGA